VSWVTASSPAYSLRASDQRNPSLLEAAGSASKLLKLLRDSIDRAPPEPVLDDELPSDDAFYEGEVETWAASE